METTSMAAQLQPKNATASQSASAASSPSLTLSPAQQLYQKAFEKTLLAELEFLLDVVQGRVVDRKTMQEQIKEKVAQATGALLSQVPSMGSLLQSVVSDGGVYLLGEIEKKKKEEATRATLQSLLKLNSAQLKILAEQCAKEAACRWEMAINHFIDEKGLMLFALTGAIRIVEYLCRKHLAIEGPHLLKGLMMGRSGAGYLNFTNTPILLVNGMVMHFEGNKELSAEGLYGRSGFIIGREYYIHDVRVAKAEEAIQAKRKLQRSEQELHFGYVKFFKADRPLNQIHHQRPKTGYVQLPNISLLEELAHPKIDGYSYITHNPHSFFEERYIYNNRCQAKTRFINEKEIEEYLSLVKQGRTKSSLNEHIGAIVFFRGALKGTAPQPLDLSQANFSGSDFSDSTLEYCKLGHWQNMNLTGARLSHVQASGDSLNGSHLSLATVSDCDFTGLKGLQTHMDYAKVNRSVFKEVLGAGMLLEGTVFDEASQASFGLSLKKTVEDLAKVQAEQQQKLQAEIARNWKAIEEQAAKLAALEEGQQKLVARHEKLGTEQQKMARDIQQLATQRMEPEFLLISQLKAGRNVSWNIPGFKHAFIGRESQLKAIEKVFSTEQKTKMDGTGGGSGGSAGALMTSVLYPSAVVVCSGIGGVGKTQLALQVLQTRTSTLKAWLPAENIQQLQDKYMELAKELGLISDKSDPIAAKRYLKHWLAINPGWLIVFDNANHYAEIESFLPDHGGCIVITTRDPEWPQSMTVIPVPLLQNQEGIAFVETLSQRKDPEIKQLVETLGGLPLALAQASAYIKLYKKTVNEYLTLYSAHQLKLLADKTLPLGTEHSPVASTWNTSLEAIEKNPEGKYARILITVCAYLAPETIPRSLLLSWLTKTYPETSELTLDKLLGLLQSHSLLEITDKGIAIHRLMQSVLVWQYQESKQSSQAYPLFSQDWYDSLLKVLHNEFVKKTQVLEDEARQNRLFFHLQSLASHFDKLWSNPNPNFSKILFDIGFMFLYRKGDPRSALAFYLRALKIQEAHYGKEHVEVAVTLTNLGNAYGALGDYKQQKELLERALKIQETHCGKECVSVASTLTNLGNAYGALGDAKQQKELLERALKIKEVHYGKEHVEVAVTLSNLGVTNGNLGDVKQKKELLERALKIQEAHYGKEHVEVAATLSNLGNAYGDLGDASLKKELLKHALKIQEAHYDKEHVSVASTLINLGNAYGVLGDAKQQKELLERALKIQEAHYGKEHVEVANTIASLGVAYGNLGDYKQAKELFERVLKIQEAHYGKEHVEVAATLSNLGVTYGTLGDVKQQKELLERALKIQEAHYGKEHVEVTFNLSGLTSAYVALGQTKLAFQFAERCCAILLKAYGADHRRTKYAQDLRRNCEKLLGVNVNTATTVLAATTLPLTFSDLAALHITAVSKQTIQTTDVNIKKRNAKKSSCILM